MNKPLHTVRSLIALGLALGMGATPAHAQAASPFDADRTGQPRLQFAHTLGKIAPNSASKVSSHAPSHTAPVGMRLTAFEPGQGIAPSRTASEQHLAPAPGVVRAHDEATLSSRMAGRISRMPWKEGDAFRRGDVLVELDCDKPRAEVRAAAAQVAIQARTMETHEELDSFNAIGKNELAISKAQHDKARAEHDALAAELKDCAITAPFSGRVTEAVARQHETVAVSQPLLKVFDLSSLELDIIVPSSWLQWLKTGQRFEFRVEETGETLKASVARMSAKVDPVSKTVRIVGRFQGTAKVLPGMSGQARFPTGGV